ncbi:hypothetical protein SAMN03097699_0772 [Flavobacteriaceae bacterium MAR_2010_188]|nr:hypothetical protein SAMN03097699_0772 [Flavobacteriaceae bacterium MAR_2010_188]
MKFTTDTAAEAGAKSTRKGIQNRSTKEIREAFKELIDNNIDHVQDWLDRVAKDNPEKALSMLIKLSEFIIPKLNRTQLSQKGANGNIHIFEIPDNMRDRDARNSRINELIKKAQDDGITN